MITRPPPSESIPDLKSPRRSFQYFPTAPKETLSPLPLRVPSFLFPEFIGVYCLSFLVKLARMRRIRYPSGCRRGKQLANAKFGGGLISRRSMTRFMKLASFIQDTGQADVI